MLLWSLRALRCSKLYRTPGSTSLTGSRPPLRFLFLQSTNTHQKKKGFHSKQPIQSRTNYRPRHKSKAAVKDDIQATTNTASVGHSTLRNIRDGFAETSLGPPLRLGRLYNLLARFAEGKYYWREPQHRFRRIPSDRRPLIWENQFVEVPLSTSIDAIHTDALSPAYTASHPSVCTQPTVGPTTTGNQWTANHPVLDGLVSARLPELRIPGSTDHIEEFKARRERTVLHHIEIWVQRLRTIQTNVTSDENEYSKEYAKTLIYSEVLREWSRSMLWMLGHNSKHQPNPGRALALLGSTLSQPFWRPTHYLLRGVLCYLTRFFLNNKTQAEPIVIEKLCRIFCAYLHTCKPRKTMEFVLPERTFHLLLQMVTEDQLISMLQAFEKLEISMPAYRMVPTIKLFLYDGRTDAALNLFRVFKWTNLDADTTDQFQRTCVRLLLKCSMQENQSGLILQTMTNLNIPIPTGHILSAIHQLINQGRIQESLDLLREFGQRHPEHINSDKFQSTCVRLLRLRPEVWNWYHIHQNMLGQILNTGIRPNITLVNVMLFAAFEAKDYQTAWQMFKIAKENGLQPNHYTYSIVINGAKHEGNGTELEAAIQSARDDGILFESAHVACDVLHATFLYEFRRTSRPFDLLLRIYSMVFTNSLLIELGMLPPDYKPPELTHFSTTGRPPVPLLEPSPRAITHMIFAYLIQSKSLPLKALNLYHAYTSMVAANHPTIATLIETEHISSAFVKAIGHHSRTLPFCTTIVENMLSPPPDWPTAEHPPAPPNVVTWSTLLAAFIFRGQKVAAQRVLEMMRERSMTPNKVSWNSMVSGYSGMQDVERAVGAVVMMEKEGWGIDEWTLKGLGRIVDKRRLMQELQKATGRNVEELAEEAGINEGVVNQD